MKFEIVELEEISGDKATIYSIWIGDDVDTCYDNFLTKYKNKYPDEIKSIVTRLEIIGQELGAREQFFKINEGVPGDGVCALFDEQDKKLRLYCIRYGKCAIIVGGGGPKTTDTWQADETLSKEVEQLINISTRITEKIKDHNSGIKWSQDGLKLIGNLNFHEDEEQ